MLKKLFRLFLIAFLFLLLLLKPKISWAASEFETNVVASYLLNTDGTTSVTYDIEIINLYTNLYVTSYLFNLEGIIPVQPQANYLNRELKVESVDTEGKTILKVLFPDAVVGKGKSRKFSISFKELSLLSKSGEVWEISIPKLYKEENFDRYSLNLLVPRSFGKLAYISPLPSFTDDQEDKKLFTFEKNSLLGKGISAAFGEFQVFSFDINYHLENPLNKGSSIEVAIPPDTAFQKITYSGLEPQPENTYQDSDGNWIAIYKLKAREKLNVKATGSVKLFSSPQILSKPDNYILEKNKQASDYWEVDDLQIKKIAQNLKTPKAIYEYVVATLTYDFERVRPNIERYGAKKALGNPNNAICMEFTDLFIALARAAGIPAREINGFAYSENPQLQPLSLVADVLHSWPEYYDEKAGLWVPVDPTWGTTTGGTDFFSKLDLRHFAFVIHGISSTKPYAPGSYKLGPNPEKDIYVTFAKPPELKKSVPKIEIEKINSLPFSTLNYTIKITNPGPLALYDSQLKVFLDNNLHFQKNIKVLTPLSHEIYPLKIESKSFGLGLANKILVQINDQKLEIATQKNEVILTNLSIIFLILLCLLLVVFLQFKDVKFSLYKKIFKKSS